MPAQTIIGGLPQSARDNIKTMHDGGGTVMEIHNWLQSQGFDRVTYGMTRGWCAKNFGVRKRAGYIEPAETFEERLQQYVDAVIAAGLQIYTLNRIRLYGPIWGACTLALKQAGIIEADNQNGSRYRLIAPFDELRWWLLNRKNGD